MADESEADGGPARGPRPRAAVLTTPDTPGHRDLGGSIPDPSPAGRADDGIPARDAASGGPPPAPSPPREGPTQAAADAAARATVRALGWRDRLADDAEFVRKILIVLAIGTLAYALAKILNVLLLIFAAVLVAVLLKAFARFIAARTPIPARWSLMVGVTLVLGATAIFLFLFGRQVAGQLANVSERLPQALNTVSRELGFGNIMDALPRMLGAGGGPGGDLVGTMASLGQRVLGAVADLLLVVVAGIYIASEPRLYQTGLLKLFPKGQQERVDDALRTSGVALLKWFNGQLVSMALVAVLSGLAYWFIGLPGFLALAVIAGVTNFIPFVGPIIGAAPALLISFTVGGNAPLWTAGAILLIQQIESNLILPIVEKRAVSLPPALALFAIVAFGVLFGFLGLFLAVPLTVVAYVLVKKLYVRETLGEETPVPGEGETMG